MEILVILFLIVLNGVFAMAEIAVVTARKSKLKQKALDGDKQAQVALELADNPNRFLSTVQIGITLIGIFAGAFGGATIADSLSEVLQTVPFIAPISNSLAFIIVVVIITYLTLIIGELVPKRLALSYPEKIAKLVAQPMNALSSASGPIVSLLSISTDAILKIIQARPSEEPVVSQEEVKMLIREGARVGVFDIAEKDIVERTLRLGDKDVNKLMTSQNEIKWIDINDSEKLIKEKVAKQPFSHFPVCDGSLNNVLGIVRTKDILTAFLVNEQINLKKALHEPVYIPENMESLLVLETFKKTGVHLALVVDEYGSILGLVTLADILEQIVGDTPNINDQELKEIIERKDGSFLVDGLMSVDEFKDHFKIKKLPGERSGEFLTVGGFVVYQLERIPVSGDIFELEDIKFEVVDMDKNRVDKVLVSPPKKV